jgi:uncharacterized protein (DUF433 family)
MRKRQSTSRQLGRYIVAAPAICHGKLTFRGTRIFVADVLEQVASGMSWEAIIEEWDRGITEEAIAEAVQLNQTTADWYTSSPAVGAIPARPERSAAESKDAQDRLRGAKSRASPPRELHSSTSPLARLRSERTEEV